MIGAIAHNGCKSSFSQTFIGLLNSKVNFLCCNNKCLYAVDKPGTIFFREDGFPGGSHIVIKLNHCRMIEIPLRYGRKSNNAPAGKWFN